MRELLCNVVRIIFATIRLSDGVHVSYVWQMVRFSPNEKKSTRYQPSFGASMCRHLNLQIKDDENTAFQER